MQRVMLAGYEGRLGPFIVAILRDIACIVIEFNSMHTPYDCYIGDGIVKDHLLYCT